MHRMQTDSLAKDEYWNIKGWGRLLVGFCFNCFHFHVLGAAPLRTDCGARSVLLFSLFSCLSFQQVFL